MGLLSVLLAFILSLAVPPSDSALLNQSKQQAEYYLTQIENDRNLDMHLWALAQLCASNSKVASHINKLTQDRLKYNLPFHPFCQENDFKDLVKKLALATSSPDLLIAALLEKQTISSQKILFDQYLQQAGMPDESMIKTKELIDRIINNKPIDVDILPLDSFSLTHFLLLFNKSSVLPNNYLKQISSSWSSLNNPFQDFPLKNSLFAASLFRSLYLIDEYPKMEKLYQTISQDSFFPISKMLMAIQRALDYSMYRLGYYDRSLNISRTFTVPLAILLGDKANELNALMRQGAYLIKIGKMEEAQRINLEVLKQANKHNVNIVKASLYNNLGITYERSGNFDKYLELLFKALGEARKQDNYPHQLDILNNLYIYYRQNNDPNSALFYLEEATKLAKDSGNQEDLGIIYTNLGIFYKKFKKDYALSVEYFNKAKGILDKKNHFNSYLALLFEEGKLYEEMGEYDSAIGNFDKTISISRDKSVKHFFEALINKTAVQLQLNELEQVSSLIAEINSYDFSQFDFKHIIKAKTVHAEFLLKTGQSGKAYTLLKPTIQQTVDWAKNSTDLQSGFWNVEQEFLDAFQLAADLLIEIGRAGEAVEVLDQLKTINDAALYQNSMVKASLLTEAELSQYQRLTSQLDRLRKQLLAASGDKQLEIQTRIDQLNAKKRTLDRKITSLADAKTTGIGEIQHQLSGYDAVIHTTELNDQYYVATISRNKVHFNKVRLDSTLRSTFSGSVQQMADGNTNLNDLYHISEILGIQNLPSWIKNITVIPDSYLYQLPIDILPLDKPETSYSYGSTTYLIERFSTQYLTSLNDFNMLTENRDSYKWDFVGYGVSDFQSFTDQDLVPLPYAQTEVHNIMKGLTNVSNKTALLDTSSTKEAFKSTAPEARILHLATHSEVSERDPMFSTIYFNQSSSDQADTGDNDFSGQIFAYELFELNLANDLIMLNSCESGSGSYLQGTGIMGISRALRYAGANTLVLNLWSVNDMMTSAFATHFYKNLNEGKTKAEALRTAKLHMLKSNNANPHYWGTYMLIGKNDAIIKPAEKTNIYLASSFMFYFLVLVTLSFIIEKRRVRRS